jgi:hypothetical protein
MSDIAVFKGISRPFHPEGLLRIASMPLSIKATTRPWVSL